MMLRFERAKILNAPKVAARAKFYRNLRDLEFKHRAYTYAEVLESRGNVERCRQKRKLA